MWLCAGVYLILAIICIAVRKKIIALEFYEVLAKRIMVIMFCVTTLAMGSEAVGRIQSKDTDIQQIERNGYGGSSKSESLKMSIDGEQEEIEIQVSPRIYDSEEIQELFREAMGRLDKEILGENESADYVDKDLNLVTELDDFPLTIVWELGRYDVMDMTGRINRDKIREIDPEEKGILLTVTGVLRYEEEEAVYSTEILLFAGDEKDEGIRGEIMALLEEADKTSRDKPYLILPDSIDGKEIIWSRSNTSEAGLLLLLGMIGSLLLVCLDKQKKEQDKKDRQAQMLLDYPEIVSQFTMLMGAGMTAKNVWKKIAEDYRKQKEFTGRMRAAYEEILYTYQEMQGGIPEIECYERFARRCELIPYMKLGALLAQNLKKGAKGIADMLMMEAVQAMEDRKSRAKQLGEEAGTRLLVPMLFMLVIVLMIVVVPAFLSIQL